MAYYEDDNPNAIDPQVVQALNDLYGGQSAEPTFRPDNYYDSPVPGTPWNAQTPWGEIGVSDYIAPQVPTEGEPYDPIVRSIPWTPTPSWFYTPPPEDVLPFDWYTYGPDGPNFQPGPYQEPLPDPPGFYDSPSPFGAPPPPFAAGPQNRGAYDWWPFARPPGPGVDPMIPRWPEPFVAPYPTRPRRGLPPSRGM